MNDLGFAEPTPIQQAVLQYALPRIGDTGVQDAVAQDVVIHAQTGSGKTLAYLLPAISAISPERSCIQALIIVPTQELGMQVYKLLRRLTTAYQHESATDDLQGTDDFSDDESVRQLKFPVLPMLNQANLRRQKLQLRQLAPRVIVGNPHRVAELVESGRLRLDLLRVLVIDEFDSCLNDTATTAALQTILGVRNRERDRQTILASATVPQHRHFLRQCVRQRWTQPDIRHVWLDESSGVRVPPSITHMYALCNARKKLAALRSLIVLLNDGLQKLGVRGMREGIAIRAMVFVMGSRNVDDIVSALNASLEIDFGVEGLRPVVGIYNDLSVIKRKDSITRFRDGDACILVGTDVAARGLDFLDVSHIFHFDLPTDADGYLHRAGRAGRQGKPGSSVVLVTKGEEFVVRRISNTLDIEFDRVERP